MACRVVGECTEDDFITKWYGYRRPCIIRGMDIGPCSHLWTPDYLTDKMSDVKEVKLHVCPQKQMDFIKKNFIYRTLSWKEFIKRVQLTDQSDYFIDPASFLLIYWLLQIWFRRRDIIYELWEMIQERYQQ
jgi:hypothetical protein